MNKVIIIILSVFVSIMSLTKQTSAQVYFHHDFAGSTNFDFDYGTWTGNVTPGAGYITIDTGANGTDGGAGFNLSGVDVTLTPAANTYMVIRARLLPTHNGTSINLILATSPTDYEVWFIPASSFNTTTFTTVLIPLSTPSNLQFGSGVTLTNVNSYQVQGNYSNTADFDIEIEYMSIIPEPNEFAVFTLLALGIFGVVFRKRIGKHNNGSFTGRRMRHALA